MKQRASQYLGKALNNPKATFREGQWESIEGLLAQKRLLVVQRNGSPDPIFETDDDHSYFLLRFPVHPKAMRSADDEKVAIQVTQQVMKLLRTGEGENSRAELMKGVSIKDRVSFSKNYLDVAIADGLLEMTQPDSHKSPTQKYRLTEKGRQLLKSLELKS